MTILPALLPIFAIIMLGWGLRKRGFPGGDFWQEAEKLIYFILLPSLFFRVSVKADFSDNTLILIPFSYAIAIALLTTLMLTFRTRLNASGPAFTSLYQGAVRFNSYVALSAASALFGAKGLTVVALAAAFLVPIINVCCVVILTLYGTNAHSISWKNTALQVAKNPLVSSCVAGLVWNKLGMPLPSLLDETLNILASAGLPFGLLVVGAGLRVQALHQAKRLIVISAVLKLLLLPLATVVIAALLGVSGEELLLATLFASLPCATSAYILARQMGGDDHMMSGIIVAQTLLAAITMPLMLALVHVVAG